MSAIFTSTYVKSIFVIVCDTLRIATLTQIKAGEGFPADSAPGKKEYLGITERNRMEASGVTERDAKAQGSPFRRVEMDAPWAWLSDGWRDMWRAPQVSLVYGAVFSLASIVLAGALYLLDWLYMLLPLAAGFMLVGPLLAVGLYETSRRLDAGLPVSLFNAAFVSARSPSQLALIGLVLMLVLLAWNRIATLLIALFIGSDLLGSGPQQIEALIESLFFTWSGLLFLMVGSAIGAVLAAIVFALSALSIPMLMVRDIDAISAASLSVRAVLANYRPMLLWAWLIAILTAFGIATLFIGLAIMFPLVGHATWRAFRGIFPDD